jgi:chemotaxis protein CheD
MHEAQAKESYRLEYHLKPGYVFFSPEPTLIYAVVGSAVMVCLWDGQKRYGGAAHFIYPKAPRREEATARYGNAAVSALIRLLIEEGSERAHLQAQIFGGGDPGPQQAGSLGLENVRIAREVLQREGIPVSSEDTGGSLGRKLIYKTDTNEVMVLKVDRLRREDWFPYGA